MSKKEPVTQEGIIANLIEVADQVGRIPPRDLYRRHPARKYSIPQIELAFGSWAEAYAAAISRNTAPVRDPETALEVIKKETEEQISERIAGWIKTCAEEMKCEPSSLVWFDFREYIQQAYGKHIADFLPRDITRVGGFNLVRDAYFPPKATALSQEKERLKDHARVNRKLGVQAAKIHARMEDVEQFTSRVFRGRIEPYSFPKSEKEVDRCVHIIISDTHFGSDLKSEETGNLDFGVTEEARRLSKVAKEIIEYKRDHRERTELCVNIIGDVIQGILHDQRDGAVLAEQQCRAIHLLTQFIAAVQPHFRKISVHFATGNHGRNKARHHERATFQKWDSHETVVYYAVKYACSRLENVEFHLPKTPYVVYERFGKKYCATHGDTYLNPGNPGKNIQVTSLENQINRINAALPDVEEYAVVMVGHVHKAMMILLDNGCWFVTNAALIPTDNFATAIGIPESGTGQWMIESVPGHPVGDSRLIRVDRSTDQDKSLDRIIQPWAGLND